MEKFKKYGYDALYVIAVLIGICSILSIFRNEEIRYLKMLDFARIQFFICSVLALILAVFLIKKWVWYNYLLIAILLIGLFVNGSYLINYTPFVSKKVPTADNPKNSENTFSLLLTNVKMSNKNSKPLIDLIKTKNPDLVLAMEVNKWWDQQLIEIGNQYPYSQHTINEVAYGMVLYSKFPIKNIEVDYLNNDNVPSFNSTITLSNGNDISFHCVHPVPPTHFKKYPDNEGQKESALIKLGKKLEDRKLPTLVAGDMNDVVWSYVDALTDTKDILHDVRTGRGFYNTYNAQSVFMKWPLDHVFVTDEFRLKSLERLNNIGSDHFPLYLELVLK